MTATDGGEGQLSSLFLNSSNASIDGNEMRPFINLKKMMTRHIGSVSSANCIRYGIAGIHRTKSRYRADSFCFDQPVSLPAGMEKPMRTWRFRCPLNT